MFLRVKMLLVGCGLLMLLAFSPAYQASFTVNVYAPESGAAVQGLVPVVGNTDVDGFVRYELSFALSASRETWFPIASSDIPVRDDLLGEWDTSNLTDDRYVLRLAVELNDKDTEVRYVENLRVRNYSVIETNTPAPSATIDPGNPLTATPTLPPPTPTPLGRNPVEIREVQIVQSVRNGIIIGILFLSGLWLYSRAQRRS